MFVPCTALLLAYPLLMGMCIRSRKADIAQLEYIMSKLPKFKHYFTHSDSSETYLPTYLPL